MEQVVLIVHLMLALAIIGLVLLQRSEGGGLGIGGGGGLGGLATPGGAASALSRITGILAFCFFGTSLVLGILAGTHSSARSILDEVGDSIPVAESIPSIPEEVEAGVVTGDVAPITDEGAEAPLPSAPVE